MDRIKLILVEDRPEWIKTFEEEIHKDPRFDYLGFATSKDSSIDMACKLQPDVVVMDIFLDTSSSREHGIDAAKEIRIKTGAKIVFFTVDTDNKELRRAACRIGFASGYIRKHDYKKYADEIYNSVTKSTPLKESIIDYVRSQLTSAEDDVLTKILASKIRGTTDYTVSQLYSNRAIAKHKTQIYKKLGLTEIPEKDREKVLIKIFNNW